MLLKWRGRNTPSTSSWAKQLNWKSDDPGIWLGNAALRIIFFDTRSKAGEKRETDLRTGLGMAYVLLLLEGRHGGILVVHRLPRQKGFELRTEVTSEFLKASQGGLRV